jgi:hypothetical protein
MAFVPSSAYANMRRAHDDVFLLTSLMLEWACKGVKRASEDAATQGEGAVP